MMDVLQASAAAAAAASGNGSAAAAAAASAGGASAAAAAAASGKHSICPSTSQRRLKCSDDSHCDERGILAR